MRPVITFWQLLILTVIWLGLPILQAEPAMPGVGGKKEGGKQNKKDKVEKVEQVVEAPLVISKEEKEDLELFKKLSRPAERPKIDERQMSAQEKRLGSLISIYHELGEKLRERKSLSEESDERTLRKNQRKISRLDRDIKKLKKDLVKEAEQLRRPLDRKYEDYLKEKADYDKKIAAAEKSNDQRRIERLSQEFARQGNRIEVTKTQIDCINYYLFWDELVGKKAE